MLSKSLSGFSGVTTVEYLTALLVLMIPDFG
jgi:hypothetical protein